MYNNVIYLIGGVTQFGYTKSVEKIDISDIPYSLKSVSSTSLPWILAESAAVLVDEDVFVFGGFNHSRIGTDETRGFGTDEIWIFSKIHMLDISFEPLNFCRLED